jgi:hypothetical protein
LDQHFAVAGFAEQKKAAVAARSNGRQRRGLEAIPIDATLAGLQSEFLGAAQDFRNANRRCAKAVPDLRGVRADAEHTQQRDQDKKSRVLSVLVAFSGHARRCVTRSGHSVGA